MIKTATWFSASRLLCIQISNSDRNEIPGSSKLLYFKTVSEDYPCNFWQCCSETLLKLLELKFGRSNKIYWNTCLCFSCIRVFVSLYYVLPCNAQKKILLRLLQNMCWTLSIKNVSTKKLHFQSTSYISAKRRLLTTRSRNAWFF